jgi:hypothetical protein
MPTNRVPLRRRKRGQITSDQELCLWLGASSNQPAPFESAEEAKELWFRHRDRLMTLFSGHGRRPMAWWWFEAPLPYPGFDNETVALLEAGLLSEDEKAEIVGRWRREFERAQAPDLMYMNEPGVVLTSRAAQRALYEDAGIPPALLRQWTAEWKRRAEVT